MIKIEWEVKILNGRIIKGFIVLLIFLVFSSSQVTAHQPRLITDEQTVDIKKPEISQAFYSTLKGQPDVYQIKVDDDFLLYLSILVPDLPNIQKDISAKVMLIDEQGNKDLLFTMHGETHHWEEFYEPFAGDHYYQGPEKEKTMSAGLYRVEVFSPSNMGKYVLSIGKEESFTFSETLHTLKSLPVLKKDFFEKSPLTAFFNLIGLFLLISIIILIIGIYIIIKNFIRIT